MLLAHADCAGSWRVGRLSLVLEDPRCAMPDGTPWLCQFDGGSRTGARAKFRNSVRRNARWILRLAPFFHCSRLDLPVVACALDLVDACRLAVDGQSESENRRQCRGDPAPPVSMGDLYWPVQLELFPLLHGHLVSILSCSRAALLVAGDGQDWRRRIPPDGDLCKCLRATAGLLDRVGPDTNESHEDVCRGWCGRVGILLVGAVAAPRNLSLALLVLVGLVFGMSTSSLWVITQRLVGPEAAGRWTGIQNFFGNLSGPIVPVVTGFLLQRAGQFFGPFLVVSIMLWIGALSWMFIVGPVEPIEWGTTHQGPMLEPSTRPA